VGIDAQKLSNDLYHTAEKNGSKLGLRGAIVEGWFLRNPLIF